MDKQNSCLCPLPWIGLEIRADGSRSFCCIANFNFAKEIKSGANGELGSIKQALLKNIKHEACSSCWKLEASGISSRRNKLNSILGDKYKKIEFNITDTFEPTFLDIKVGNGCNQKCLICGPESSSLWFNEYKYFDPSLPLKRNFNLTKHKELLAESIQKAEEIHIAGGEPFLFELELSEFLELSVKSGKSRKQTLLITSNGSIYPAHLIEKVFPHFENVKIHLSADGIGEQFDYQRFPGKWAIFLENYKKLQNTAFFDGICITLSCLNIFYLAEYLSFWDSLSEQKVFINYLFEPAFLSIEKLPKQLIDRVVRHLVQQEFKNMSFNFLISEILQFLDNAENHEKTEVDELVNFLDKHDKYRDLKYETHFPEFASLLKNTWHEKTP